MNDLIDGTRHTGDVLLDGKDIYDPKREPRRSAPAGGHGVPEVEPVPQDRSSRTWCSGRAWPGCGDRARLHGDLPSAACTRAALWDEVKDRLDDSALNLSGGQQQRLCIARALATDPEVLLLDEPASALDPASTARIEDLIFELKRDYTIVIVTHNMQQAARVSDQTAFFFQGRLIETGPTDGLYTRPQVKQTEDYITGRFG